MRAGGRNSQDDVSVHSPDGKFFMMILHRTSENEGSASTGRRDFSALAGR